MVMFLAPLYNHVPPDTFLFVGNHEKKLELKRKK
jgi:hypothetical protein